jgi:hypothetical protein
VPLEASPRICEGRACERDRAGKLMSVLEERIAEMPATCLEDLFVKARCAHLSGFTDDPLGASIVRDLLKLARVKSTNASRHSLNGEPVAPMSGATSTLKLPWLSYVSHDGNFLDRFGSYARRFTPAVFFISLRGIPAYSQAFQWRA